MLCGTEDQVGGRTKLEHLHIFDANVLEDITLTLPIILSTAFRQNYLFQPKTIYRLLKPWFGGIKIAKKSLSSPTKSYSLG